MPLMKNIPSSLVNWRARILSKQTLFRTARTVTPTLVALCVVSAAHAQGTMDFSGAQTLMSTFKTFAMYAGAVICLGGLIFAGIRMMSGRFQDAIPGLFGALFGAGVLGWGAGWIGFDHGYAVTSHSAQGLTAGRVLAHFDTDSSHSLINTRLAYVAVSRASDDVRVYTNHAETLGQRLATDISKTSAVDFRPTSSTDEVQQAVAAFCAYDPATGTAKLQRQGRIHEYASPEHRLAAVALAYAAQEDRAVVIAPDSAERRELTQLIRDELRAQGRLAAENHAVSILVEQDFGNPRLAANYSPGDQIHYKAGSPAEHGIADNSTAIILSVDPHANTLTVATRDGNEASYNPALLKKQTAQSTVYREEQRDLSVGERVLFTESDRKAHIRSGDFGTLEQVADDNALSVRLDNGKSVELTSEQARHIEYGYTVETARRTAVDRVLVTGDASQLIEHEALVRLSPHLRDLAIYTSNSRELGAEKAIPGTEIARLLKELSPNLNKVSVPEIEVEGFGIGL